MRGHREIKRALTLWRLDLSPFRINLPIQTFSALNFRGECMLVGGHWNGRGQESSMGTAQGQPGRGNGAGGMELGSGTEKGSSCRWVGKFG